MANNQRKWPNGTSGAASINLGVQMEARVQSMKKERGINSHDFNKLNKTNMLSAKISKEYKNSRISTPSVDMSRPSRDPYRSFKSQHQCQNFLSGFLCCHR